MTIQQFNKHALATLMYEASFQALRWGWEMTGMEGCAEMNTYSPCSPGAETDKQFGLDHMKFLAHNLRVFLTSGKVK